MLFSCNSTNRAMNFCGKKLNFYYQISLQEGKFQLKSKMNIRGDASSLLYEEGNFSLLGDTVNLEVKKSGVKLNTLTSDYISNVNMWGI